MHPDHCGDLPALANWALNTANGPRIPVAGPETWDARLNAFISNDNKADVVADIFDVQYLQDGGTLSAGEFNLASRLVHHSVATYGVRVSDGTHTIAYSGDSGPCAALDEVADNADLFLCEAGSNEPAEYHMTAQQAHELAVRANTRRLILTHIPADAPVNKPAGQSAPSDIAYPGGEWLTSE